MGRLYFLTGLSTTCGKPGFPYRPYPLFADRKRISNRDPKWDTLEKLQDEYEKIANRMHKAGSRFANALIDFDQKASTVKNAAHCSGY